MNFHSGDIVEVLETTAGIYVLENDNDITTTKKMNVEKGYYIVLDTIGGSLNYYIEILCKSTIVLIFYSNKVSRIDDD